SRSWKTIQPSVQLTASQSAPSELGQTVMRAFRVTARSRAARSVPTSSLTLEACREFCRNIVNAGTPSAIKTAPRAIVISNSARVNPFCHMLQLRRSPRQLSRTAPKCRCGASQYKKRLCGDPSASPGRCRPRTLGVWNTIRWPLGFSELTKAGREFRECDARHISAGVLVVLERKAALAPCLDAPVQRGRAQEAQLTQRRRGQGRDFTEFADGDYTDRR